MLYPVIGTLSNVYGADHISKTLDPLITVAVRSLTGASKPTSIYHNNITSLTLAHIVFLIHICYCIHLLEKPYAVHDILVLLLSFNAFASNTLLTLLPLRVYGNC